MKSTRDGWLNRYLQRASTRASDTVPRGRARRRSCRDAAGHRAGAGDEPARPVLHARRPARDAVEASFEARVRGRGRPVCSRHGQRGIRRGARCSRRPIPRSYQPANGAEYPRSRLRPGAAPDRAADQGRTSASRSRSPKSAAGTRTSTRAPRTASSPTRLDDFARGIAALVARSRRPHGRHRDPDDVGVRAGGGRERQSRHRSRARQRDDGHRRRTSAAARSTAGGRAWRRNSATTAATWRSPPISATSSPKSSAVTSACADSAPIFPGYDNPQRPRVSGD